MLLLHFGDTYSKTISLFANGHWNQLFNVVGSLPSIVQWTYKRCSCRDVENGSLFQLCKQGYIQKSITRCWCTQRTSRLLQTVSIWDWADPNGEKTNDDTGSVLKLSTLNEDEVEKMNKVQVHNIGKERSVGFFNYEIGFRGKKKCWSSVKENGPK